MEGLYEEASTRSSGHNHCVGTERFIITAGRFSLSLSLALSQAYILDKEKRLQGTRVKKLFLLSFCSWDSSAWSLEFYFRTFSLVLSLWCYLQCLHFCIALLFAGDVDYVIVLALVYFIFFFKIFCAGILEDSLKWAFWKLKSPWTIVNPFGNFLSLFHRYYLLLSVFVFLLHCFEMFYLFSSNVFLLHCWCARNLIDKSSILQ